MINPLKFLFGSLINWIVLLGVLGAGYLTYVQFQAAQLSPQGVVEEFVELIQNPTDVISSEEKKTLNTITDSNIISSQKYQGYIKLFRQINLDSPIQIIGIEQQGDAYHEATLEFANNDTAGENTQIRLFIEQYGEWYTGIKHRIFHLELINIDANENELIQGELIEAFDSIKDTVTENFGDLKDKYGEDLLELLLPASEKEKDLE